MNFFNRLSAHDWRVGGHPISFHDLCILLGTLVALNIVYILILENAFTIRDHFTLLGLPDSYYEKSWWEYLLPQKDVFGTWASTSVVAAALVQQYIHPALVLAFCQCTLVVVAFIVALDLTKSPVFAATAALLCVTVPFNFHVYSVHGTTAQALLVSYFVMTVHAAYLVVTTRSSRAKMYLGIAGALFVLGYETWIDTAVVLAVVALPTFLAIRRYGEDWVAWRFLKFTAGVMAILALYVVVKTSFGFGSGEGSETDLLLHYDQLSPMIDDFFSTVVGFFYTAASLFLPPELTGSLSLPRYGGEWIIEQQHGYHPQMQFLTYMNHVFMWRYFAGAYFALTLVLGLWALKHIWNGDRRWQFWMLFFGVALLLFGACTHSLVKYRPMHSMPYLGYQVWANVVGGMAIVSVLVDYLVSRVPKRWAFVTLATCWAALIYIGFAVRANLANNATNMMMGTYPDPRSTMSIGLPF